MGITIDRQKCISCGKCESICPGDLIRLTGPENKAEIICNEDCWDCFACTKKCPTNAIQNVLPFQIANRGAKLTPKVSENQLDWTLQHPDGKTEQFTIKTKETTQTK